MNPKDPDFKFWVGLGGGGEQPSEVTQARDREAKKNFVDMMLVGATVNVGSIALLKLVASLLV